VAGYTTDPVLNAGGTAVAAERPVTLAGDDGALAGAVDGYLASKGSPLTGLGATFVSESRAVGLDPRFLVAVSGAETSFGTYGPSQVIHNPFGMGPGISYPSWADAIRAAATNLAGSLYAGDGRVTIGAIQQRWAPGGASNDPTDLNSNWATNVSTYYAALGGDPLGAVFTGATATADALLSSTALAPAVAVPGAAQGTLAAPVAYRAPEPVLGRSGRGSEAATEAQTMIGTRSVKRGANPDRGFDGAGLVRWAYAREGVTLPRAASEQATVGDPVAPADLRPGDVVFFADPSGYIHHEGIYIGDDLFVQAPGADDVVKVSSLLEPFYAEAYAGARRY
jgi:cell wall-associated NlpC family hydrolase